MGTSGRKHCTRKPKYRDNASIEKLYSIDWKTAEDIIVVKAAVYCVENNVNPPADLSKRFYNNQKLETVFMDACLSKGLEAKLPKSITP